MKTHQHPTETFSLMEHLRKEAMRFHSWSARHLPTTGNRLRSAARLRALSRPLPSICCTNGQCRQDTLCPSCACFSRFSIMGTCFMLELGKKRGEKPAPQASGSCGVSASQGRQLCFTLHTSFQCALDVWMSNLIQTGTGTCQGHSGVSGSASMEPGLPPPPPPFPRPPPLPHRSQLYPTLPLCHALGYGFTHILFIQNSPLRNMQSPLLVAHYPASRGPRDRTCAGAALTAGGRTTSEISVVPLPSCGIAGRGQTMKTHHTLCFPTNHTTLKTQQQSGDLGGVQGAGHAAPPWGPASEEMPAGLRGLQAVGHGTQMPTSFPSTARPEVWSCGPRSPFRSPPL